MSTRMSTTAGQHTFARIPQAEIQRSVFDRSHGLKTAFRAGQLIPIYVDEALPGDTFQLTCASFGRLSTLLVPIMDNLFVDYFFFAVPNRLIWTNWKKFMGEQASPTDSTDFTIPQTVAPPGGWPEESLYDYFGLPPQVANLSVSALPFRAYNLIWNEWFRDENLQSSVGVPTNNGPDNTLNYALLPRGKRHDYFSSALPWPQKGQAVTLPMTGNAPLAGIPLLDFGTHQNTQLVAVQGQGAHVMSSAQIGDVNSVGTFTLANGTQTAYADLSQATAATINQLREAFAIQRLFERDARGGTRYTETIRAHFGVVSPDSRMQRPEFLGGGTVRININPVAQTAPDADQSAVGELAAFGTFAGTRVGFSQSFTEHCTLIGLACLRADLNYQQGIERMWSRRTRFDFYWPALAHLGEQEVLNKEIYAQGTAADDQVFGYQERFAEYRYKPSFVTGRMRSSSAASLDNWHLAQDFASLPLLNESFIVENPPIDRVVAVTSALEPPVLLDAFFSVRCARPMPVFGVPGLIDHF